MGIEVAQLGDGTRRLLDDQTGNTVECADGTTRIVGTKIASLLRTNTVDTNLFTLPAGAIPIDLKVWFATGSNAGTSANISVGVTGSDTTFLSAFDVKGTAPGAQSRPAATNLFAAQSTSQQTQVVGKYAETGSASTAGGPFWLAVDYYLS